MSTTKINSWQEVEKLRRFPGLNDLRIQGCPFLDELNRKEKRTMLVARLPNVKVLNGGDMISKTEREDSERAFIRYFLDTPEQARPERWQELVEVHGILDPLVNIDLSPDMSVKVSQTNPSLVRKVSIFLYFFRFASISKINAGKRRSLYVRRSNSSSKLCTVTSVWPQPI